MAEPTVHDIFEPVTATWQYVVADPATKHAFIIDSVLDYDPNTGSVKTTSADSLLAVVREHGYTVDRILETHAHADHLTASRYLQARLGATQVRRPDVCIGRRIGEVQARFAAKYGIPASEYAGAFDCLLDDDEEFPLGGLTAKALHLPGHTPDHMGYQIGANVFCGDSLFNADVGSARCDFPGGDAEALYGSVQRLLALPAETKIWTGHDYPPTPAAGADRRAPLPYMTVAEQRERNAHLKTGTDRAEFIAWRRGRDATLGPPRLLHQSLQVNVRGGRLPPAAEDGSRFVLAPLKVQGEAW